MASRNYYTSVVMGTTAGAGILSAYPPKYAYGLVKIHPSATFAGRCTRADGATQDIGFIGDDLDTAALTSFCGAQVGKFAFYEQSGTGINATIPSFALGPTIYNGSAIITDPTNGKPAVLFSSPASRMNVPLSTATFKFLHDGTKSAMFVQFNPTGSGFRRILQNNLGTSAQVGVGVFLDGSTFGVIVNNGTSGQTVALVNVVGYTSLLPKLSSLFFDVTNATLLTKLEIATNGGALFSNNTFSATRSTANAGGSAQIGGQGNDSASLNFSGYIQHLTFYDTDQLANKSAIETPLIAYYA